MLANGQSKPWSVKACWFCGIIFALFAVLTAAQQSLRLHRLSAHRDGLELIRRCMARQNPDGADRHGMPPAAGGGQAGDVTVKPHRMQVYAWQASLMFLVASVVCLIAGITVLVWVSAGYGPKKTPADGWWDGNSFVSINVTAFAGKRTGVLIINSWPLSTPWPLCSQQ